MLNEVDDITVYGLGIAVPHSFHSFGSLALRMKFCSCFALAWSGVDGGVANVMPPYKLLKCTAAEYSTS